MVRTICTISVMPVLRRLLWQLVLVIALAIPVAAQTPATLVADQVQLSGDATITATGNVEVLYEGSRLRAPRISYLRGEDRILIDGPITLVQPDGTVLTADQADLDSDLMNGILLGARIVLDEQMQIAGAEAFRVSGRYNQVRKAVASSCRICGDGPPLWQIRAEKVVHDQEEKQLYFYDARFEVGGIPIAYLPRLRLPDPTLERATGFLVPRVRISDLFGTGIRVPYFIAIDDHQDLLLTPYVAPKTTTLEFRYRRALRNGSLTIQGAGSSDTLRPGQFRYYVRGDLSYRLPRDFQLDVSVMDVSDGTYASEYGYPIGSELRSSASLSRTKRSTYSSVTGVYYETRAATPSLSFQTNPTGQLEFLHDRRIATPRLGGEARFRFSVTGLNRPATTITPAILAACGTSATVDCTARDTLQAATEIDWQRSWTLAGGLRAEVEGGASGSLVLTQNDPAFASELYQAVPSAALRLRWPLAREAMNGRQVLEPFLQVAYSAVLGDTLPNDDSRLSELDFGNLLKIDRFAGNDRSEDGAQVTLGATWSHYGNKGWALHLAGGRIFRDRAVAGFTPSSGLSGVTSDYLLAGLFKTGNLAFQARARLDTNLAVTGAEGRFSVALGRAAMSGSYLYSLADAAEGRATDIHEIGLNGSVELSQRWSSNLSTRFDLVAARQDDTSLTLTYQNECIRVGLNWTQRYISSTSATQETAYGITIGLNGVGNDARRFRRNCSS